MDVITTAYNLKYLVNERVKSESEVFKHGSKEHLLWMCDRIIGNELDAHRQKVEGEKAHRWIGWIQGCLYMNGVTTDEMKELNKNS